jgi:UDP-N-acetylmuramyl pentapeptide phosphotransferase/UDP-N-acetylglucosamine-1-phosphate transferase
MAKIKYRLENGRKKYYIISELRFFRPAQPGFRTEQKTGFARRSGTPFSRTAVCKHMTGKALPQQRNVRVMETLKHLFANIIYPLAAFAVSLILTRVCITVLPHLGYMDMPKGRHIHKKPAPRAGGIGFILAFWFSIMLYAGKLCGGDLAKLADQNVGQFLIALGGASVILFFTGLYDDRFDMPSAIKLLFHIVAGITLFFLGGGIRTIFDYTLPWYFALAVTVCWTIGIVNAFNLIDGLDGLAAGLASISSLCIAAWILISGGNLPMVILLFTFCGACLGFLVFNFSPARIFMGDTGSMFLGLFFAMTSMDQCSRPAVTVAALLVPLVAIGVPIFDVILAIWRRSVRRFSVLLLKENLDDAEAVTELEHGIDATGRIEIESVLRNGNGVMDPDQDHLHHRILRESHNRTSRAVLLIYAISIVFSLGAIALTFIGQNMPALAFLLVIIGVFFTLRLANIELLASMSVVTQGVRFPRKSFILTAAHPLIDFLMVAVSFFLIYALLQRPVRATYNIYMFLILVVPYFLVLIFSGIYRTYWLRAGIERYFRLMKLLVLAACISFILLNIFAMKGWVLDGISKRMAIIIFLLQTSLAFASIITERFLLHFFEAFAIRSYYLKNSPEAGQHNTIIYGGGLGCRMYINSLYSSRHLSCPFHILGIVDEDPSLQKLNVYGFRVLGTSDDLETLYKKKPFDTIVFTTVNITDKSIDKVRTFARAHNVRMTMFLSQEYPANLELFEMLQSKAINPFTEDNPDDPGLGI